MFDNQNLIVLDGKCYERMNEHPTHRYRVILSSDDYDYVEDQELINRLDQEQVI